MPLHRWAWLAAVVWLSACGDAGSPMRNDGDGATGRADADPIDDGEAGPAPRDDADVGRDASVDPDAAVDPDAGAPPPVGIAPDGAVPGESPGADGETSIALDGPDEILRVEVTPGEHVAFVVMFAPSGADVELEVFRWDGARPVSIGLTDAGGGIRTLAVCDQEAPRTFWAHVRTLGDPLDATLTITRTPFEEGVVCTEDCDRLLQLPLPNDAAVDGYDHTAGTVFRYQFGRRDLVMFVRAAGRRVISLGMTPFFPEDLSQWDGLTPGSDTGSLRHASHQRGKDVDISLYGTDGLAPWRSYCDAESTSEGRECRAGSQHDFDGFANALMIGSFYESGRVTMCFLDGELIPYVESGAAQAAEAGLLDASLVPLFADGRHLQHWPNHDNHVHVRVSEEPTGGAAFLWRFPEVEPP